MPRPGTTPWFTVVESRAAAESLKLRVRRLCRDDPREIRSRMIRLRDLVRELEVL